MPDPFGDLRRVTFEGLLAEAVMAIHALEKLTRRDASATFAAVVAEARAAYTEIVELREALNLTREQASLLQDKLDRLQAHLRFFETDTRQ
jgi:hypothetical protein